MDKDLSNLFDDDDVESAMRENQTNSNALSESGSLADLGAKEVLEDTSVKERNKEDYEIEKSKESANPSGIPSEDEEEMENLFGEESEGDNDDAPSKRNVDEDVQEPADQQDNFEQNYMDPDETDQQLSLDGAIPDQDILTSEKEHLYLVKLPNFLDIDPLPFDRDNFQDDLEIDDEEAEDRIKLKIENTLRWKYVKDSAGNVMRKQSNARLIRWSDESYSLLLGEELFEVAIMSMEHENQFLVAQYPQDGFFHAQTKLKKQMTFRPHSTNSITHKKLTMAIANKHRKEMKTKTFTPEIHPETNLLEVERTENEKLKARRRLEAKRRTAASRYGTLTEAGLEGDSDDELYPRRNYDTLDAYEDDFVVDDEEQGDYLDEEEDEMDARVMNAKSSKKGKETAIDYSSEDDSLSGKKETESQKRGPEDDRSSEGEGEFAIKKANKKRRTIDDEDSE